MSVKSGALVYLIKICRKMTDEITVILNICRQMSTGGGEPRVWTALLTAVIVADNPTLYLYNMLHFSHAY